VTISVYESDLVAVRALYVQNRLDWYAITLLSDELQIPNCGSCGNC